MSRRANGEYNWCCYRDEVNEKEVLHSRCWTGQQREEVHVPVGRKGYDLSIGFNLSSAH